jgi:hypothetical protein
MKPIALLCSDIHLQEKPPISRSAEPDWFRAMQRPLDEIRGLSMSHDIPIIYAGDIFNHWKAPPELINWALKYLPKGYAVPGQHDLPFHNYDDMFKSAFGTLVDVGHLTLLPPAKPLRIGKNLRAWGFPWGTKLKMMPTFVGKDKACVDLAVVHAYIWREGKGYPGADEEKRVGVYATALKGFEAAVFGDNHKGFTAYKNGCSILNNGTLMRRNSDEVDYEPQVGLLMEDGSIEIHLLKSCKPDKFLPREEAKLIEEAGFKMEEFLKELEKLGHTNMDFRQSLKDYFTTYEVSPAAKTILLNALENAK